MSQLSVNALSIQDSQGKWLVQPCSFILPAGAALSIIGESGSGKSLLVQAIMGSLSPSLRARGNITLDGQSSSAEQGEHRRQWWGHTLALLPQEPWLALDPSMHADTQIAESYRFVNRTALTRKAAKQQARADLVQLGVTNAQGKYPFMLSGGMAQRVAFAATRAGGAQIVIVDEPTKGLDADARDNLLSVLQDVLAQGGSVLTITHDMHVARMLGGDVMVMRDSQVLEHGPAAEVLAAPRHDYTRALLAAEPEHWPTPSKAPVTRTQAQPLLQAENLSKHFGQQRLFNGINLEIQAGERIAISGPSGSGKTTLGNILLGLQASDSGHITLANGINNRHFQKLYQDPVSAFAPRYPLAQSFDDLVRLHRLAPQSLPALLARLGLDTALLQRLPSQVSGGELQRLALARILMLSPALIFADEPTSRLDPISQQQTMALLLEMAEERQCAILLVTHDTALSAHTTDRQIRLE